MQSRSFNMISAIPAYRVPFKSNTPIKTKEQEEQKNVQVMNELLALKKEEVNGFVMGDMGASVTRPCPNENANVIINMAHNRNNGIKTLSVRKTYDDTSNIFITHDDEVIASMNNRSSFKDPRNSALFERTYTHLRSLVNDNDIIQRFNNIRRIP